MSNVIPFFLTGELSKSVSEVLLFVGERGCAELVSVVDLADVVDLVGVIDLVDVVDLVSVAELVNVAGLAGVTGMLPIELRVDCRRLLLLRLGDI